jgi:hypothetical protein
LAAENVNEAIVVYSLTGETRGSQKNREFYSMVVVEVELVALFN